MLLKDKDTSNPLIKYTMSFVNELESSLVDGNYVNYTRQELSDEQAKVVEIRERSNTNFDNILATMNS